MELLLDWLNVEVKLSQKITDVDSQFSNGYLFSELLQKYNQILDIKIFKNKDSKNSIVKNFSELERVFRRLGVNFNLTQAIQIKNKEKGVAVKLLRVLKDVLEKTEGLVDIQILARTGHKNLTFPVKKIDFSKAKYEEIQNKIFYRRLYNTIPEQQELNLRKKNRKFLQMQDKIKEIKLAEKQRIETENFEHKVYMREILLSQLQRKKNYAKEWTSICEEQFRKNQLVTLNRKNFEKMFYKKKKFEETQKNNKRIVLNKTQIVVENIDEFEENKLRLQNNEDQNESGKIYLYNIAREIVKKVQKDSDVYLISQDIKSRENEHYKEKSKKERDRRLRKMIVDLKRDRLANNFKETQQLMKESINQNSQCEESLLDTFASIRKFKEIFVDNLALMKDMQWEKHQQEENNKEKCEEHEQELQIIQKENNTLNQLQLYLLESERTEIKQFHKKYEVMELLTKEIIEENFEFANQNEIQIQKNESLNSKINNQLLQRDKGTKISDISVSDKYFIEYLSQFNRTQVFWEEFNKAIYSAYLSSIQKQKIDQPSYEYLDARVLIIGMPQTEQMFMASHLGNLFNIKHLNIERSVEYLFLKKNIDDLNEYEKEILKQLQQGQEVSYCMEVSYLISILENTFGRYLMNDKIKINQYVLNSENPSVMQKLQSVGEETNDEQTKKIENLKNQDKENWDKMETIKNKKVEKKIKKVPEVIMEESNIQDDVAQSSNPQANSLKIDSKQDIYKKQEIVLNEEENSPQEINEQENQQSESSKEILEQPVIYESVLQENVIQKTTNQESVQHQQDKKKRIRDIEGVILSLETIEKVIFFEQNISQLKPENKIELNDLQLMNQSVNMIYHQKIPLEKEKQKVFFDCVFILQKNSHQIIQEINTQDQNLKDNNKLSQLFDYKAINQREQQLRQIKEFYEGYNGEENEQKVHEYVIDDNLPEVIDQIEQKVQSTIDKKQHLKRGLKEMNSIMQQEMEKQKRLQMKLEEEKQLNKYQAINEWIDIVNEQLQSKKTNNYIQNNISIFKCLLQQYKENVVNIINKQDSNKTLLKQTLYDVQTTITQEANVSVKMNVLLQTYIQIYNQFYFQNKEVVENDQIQEELFMRCNELKDQFETLIQQTHLSLEDSFKTSLDTSFFDELKGSENQAFIQLLTEEINKYLGEKHIINMITQKEGVQIQTETDSKNKNKEKVIDEIQALNYELCDLSSLLSEVKQKISQPNSSENSFKAVIDLLQDKVPLMIQSEDFFMQVVNSKAPKAKQQKGEKVAEQEAQNETIEQMKKELVQRAQSLIKSFKENLEEIQSNQKRSHDLMHSILQTSFTQYQKCIKIVIEKLSFYITEQQPIYRALSFRNYQIIEDYKKFYRPEEIEEIIEIVEMNDQSKSLRFEDLLTMQKIIQQNGDSIGKVSKKKIREIMMRIKRGQIDEVQLSDKWLSLENDDYENLINNFTDYEDDSQIMWKVFFINILLEEFTIPSQSLLKHYKQFSKKNKIISLEQFITIKLFFEYDQNNEIIKDDQKTLHFKFLKERIFELFYDKHEESLNFDDLIDYFGYLYEIFEDIEGNGYFETMIKNK